LRNWRHGNGATRAPASRSASAFPLWNDGSIAVEMSRMIRSACCVFRKRRGDAGEQTSMTPALRQALLAQYNAHKGWSASLIHDNLAALAKTRAELRPVPSSRNGSAIPGRTRPDQTATDDDGTVAGLGVRRQSPLAGAYRWWVGISVRSRSPASHCRRRCEPEAEDPRLAATSASAAIC